MSQTGSGTQDEVQAQLAQASAARRRNMLIGGGAAVVAIALLSYFLVFQNDAGGASGDDELISLKIADTAQSDYQDAMVEIGKENGLDLEFINFQDAVLPNTALVQGEVDANSFQHVAFAASFNQENDANITPLFSMYISNWGLFSNKHDSVEDLSDGARIAVPSDPSNLARALGILQSGGLLELDDKGGSFPTEENITANPKNLELVPLSHEATHTAYEDPSIDGVVDGLDEFDPKFELTPDDALALQDPQAEGSVPYTISMATTADSVQENAEAWERLETTWRDPRVAEALKEERGEFVTMSDVPADELKAALEEITNP